MRPAAACRRPRPRRSTTSPTAPIWTRPRVAPTRSRASRRSSRRLRSPSRRSSYVARAGRLPGLDEAGPVCEYDGLDAVAQAELRQDVGEVGLDGRFGQEQRGCDLAVREATGDENEDVELSLGQLRELRRLRGAGRWAADELLDKPAGDRRCEERVAGGDGADGVGELLGADVLEEEAAGTGLHGLVDVLVRVESGQDEHAGNAVGGEEAPCRL